LREIVVRIFYIHNELTGSLKIVDWKDTMD